MLHWKIVVLRKRVLYLVIHEKLSSLNLMWRFARNALAEKIFGNKFCLSPFAQRKGFYLKLSHCLTYEINGDTLG